MSADASSISNSVGAIGGHKAKFDADRFGVVASTLCAIHCAATPFLLLLLPTFGKAWAHPATHWGMALVVVPIAILMMSKGYKRHRRKWIIAIGSAGILFVLAGAVAPYLDGSSGGSTASASTGSCADPCCPSVVAQEDGSKTLNVPMASILTTAGGLFLIVTHIGNLCRCKGCKDGCGA